MKWARSQKVAYINYDLLIMRWSIVFRYADVSESMVPLVFETPSVPLMCGLFIFRAAFMCGREPNFELSEEEKLELSKFKWEEFLAVTRQSITCKSNFIFSFNLFHVFPTPVFT